MDTDLSHIPAKCADCILGKQKKKPVSKRRKGPRSTRKLQKVFADLAGPQAVAARGGYLYTLQLIDDYSHEQWTILLKRKSEAAQQIKEWIAIVEAESGEKVGIFRVDLGTEFDKAGFIRYLREHGIRKETSAPYSSAQMGLIERIHHTLMSRALASLSSAKLPRNMWGEMMLTETYIKNRTLTSAFRNPEQTPHERWTEEKPDLSHMREIGCRAFVLKLPKAKNPKIFNRSVECVMIGYSPSLRGTYHCYERKTGRVHVTRNVEFIESQDEVPRLLKTPKSAKSTLGAIDGVVDDADVQRPLAAVHPPSDTDEFASENEEEDETGPAHETEEEAERAPEPAHNVGRPVRTRKVRGDDGAFPDARKDAAVVDARAAETRAKERRIEAKSRRATVEAVNDDEPPSAAVEEEPAPRPNAEEYEYWAFSATASDDEPKTWKQAQNSPFSEEWRAAYQAELDSIKLHGVYELVPPESIPAGRK
jgi:hypothetical protein